MFEPLELRRLLSVTVTETYPGYYEVDGDKSDDAISISISQTNDTFTLGDTTYHDVAYINVNGNGGNDKIIVNSPEGYGLIGASIVTGSGNDYIETNVGGGVWAGAGDDEIHVTDAYRGSIFGQDGNDKIYLNGDVVDAIINGGGGDDLLDATNSNVPVTMHGGSGNDTLLGSNYDDELYGDSDGDSLVGNAGNDILYARTGSNDDVDGGPGDDICYANGAESGITGVETVLYQ